MDGGGVGAGACVWAAAKNDAINGKARRRAAEVIDAGKCIRLGLLRKAPDEGALVLYKPDIALRGDHLA
jgi:hypothetical protein